MAVAGLSIVVAMVAALATIAFGPLVFGIAASIVVAVVLARQPLLLLVAFLYVGIFKQTAVLAALPFDATLALGALLVAVCLHRLLEGRFHAPPLLLVAPLGALIAMLAIGMLSTPEPGYGSEKLLKFVTFTLLGTVAPFFLLESRDDVRKLLALIVAAAVLGAVSLMLFGTSEAAHAEGRLTLGDAGNTIFTTRLLVTGAFLIVMGLTLRIWRRRRVALALTAIALMAVAVSIGSRGPMIALALALAVTAAAVVLRQPRRIMPLLAMVAVGAALLPFVSLPEASTERLEKVAADPVAALQEDLRSALYDRAVDLTLEHPLAGVGTGGFKLYGGVDTVGVYSYPHNLFLEISSELGVLAAVLVALSLVAALLMLYRRAWDASGENRNLLYVVAGLLVLNLFAAQLSGDINDNKSFWSMLGVAWLLAWHGVPGRAEARSAAPIAVDRAQVGRRSGRRVPA